MNTVSTLALIFAVLILVKLAVVLINPQAWIKLTDPLWRNNNLTLIICLALAGIVGYFLLQELTIVEVSAVFLFAALLIGAGFVSYPKVLFALKKDVEKESGAKILQKNLLTVLIWAAFAIWTLWAIFF